MNRRTFLAAAAGGMAATLCPGLLPRPASATSVGVSPLEIRLCTSLGLSGPKALQAYHFLYGFLSVVEATNAPQARIHDRRLTLFAPDNRGDPRRAVAQVRQLIEEKGVLGLTAFGDGDALVRLLPLLRRPGAPPLFGCRTGLDLSGEPGPGLRRTLRPTFDEEMKAWLRVWPRQVRAAICHAGDVDGRVLTSALRRALAEHGAASPVEWVLPRHPDAQALVAAQQYLDGAGVDTVVLDLPYAGVVDWLLEADRHAWSPNTVLPSTVAGEAVATQLARRGDAAPGRPLFQSRIVPPLDTTEPRIGAFRKIISEPLPSLDAWKPEDELARPWSAAGLQGYLTGQALVRSLERAGPNVDRDLWVAQAASETLWPSDEVSPAPGSSGPDPTDPEASGLVSDGAGPGGLVEGEAASSPQEPAPQTRGAKIWLTRLGAAGRWRVLETAEPKPVASTPPPLAIDSNEIPPIR